MRTTINSRCADTLHSAHHDILMRTQTLCIPGLCGRIHSMYPIDDQCRIELVGRRSDVQGSAPVWLYEVTMPLMCLTDHAAARAEVRFAAPLSAPYSEEKLRYGCLLQADCLVCPHSAMQVESGLYQITYDAHISLYLSCHACCS